VKHNLARLALYLIAPVALIACGDDSANSNTQADVGDAGGDSGTIDLPSTYEFESRFEAGASSVAFDGQIFRHVLIRALSSRIDGLTAQIDDGTIAPTEDGDVVALLDFYFRFDGESYGDALLPLTTTPAALQSTWNDLSSGKDLVGKIAGNDTVTDHVDWTTAFAGWSDTSLADNGGTITSPEGFVIALFETIEQNALDRANGVDRHGPDGQPLPVHVTTSGVDLRQLTEKFLLGAVVFHQGADDYLDSDVDGKGLLSPNTRDADEPFTVLEHAWDEAFGYFGASINYGDYTDEEIAAAGGRPEFAAGYNDADGDGAINLVGEYVFGAASNAAKRDRGANSTTDFTADIFEAFVDGRSLITAAPDTLTDDQMAALETSRDAIVEGWEAVIAASGVHYINEVLVDMAAFDTDAYVFVDHAKHWSEMKGFLLAAQFNPASPLTDADFETLHTLLGDAPTLAAAGVEAIEAYRTNLLEARGLLGDAYGFDAANLGDDNGLNGW
jgi:hypothetical protein